MTAPGPDWVEQARRFAAGLAAEHAAGAGLSDVLDGLLGPAAGQPAADAGPDHGAECRWCPLCAGLAALRGRRPDLLDGLADLLTTAATVVRAHAAAPADPGSAEPAPEPAPEPGPAPVQRIEVA